MYKIKQIPQDFIVIEKTNQKFQKGNYHYFKLTKTNFTTAQATSKIADILKIPLKSIGYAGTKDKKAITTQAISIKTKRELKNFTINKPNLKLIYLGTKNKPLSLGDLEGNHFEITIRNITNQPKNPISPIFIPNYFDKQRFSTNNKEIGEFIIKKDFKSAAKLLEANNHPKLIQHLKKYPTDYVGAIMKINKRILLLYIHSYQSFLFNELLSQYIIQHLKKYITKTFSFGKLAFPLEKISKQRKLPIIGFNTKPSCSKILKKHKISKRDFIIKQLPLLSQQGDMRNAFIEVKNLKFFKLKKDELNKNKKKITISFTLQKGSYATMVIKYLFI